MGLERHETIQTGKGGEGLTSRSADRRGHPLRAQGRLHDAFIIGRGYTDPVNPLAGYSGPSMALGAYTTFVKVNP